MCLPAPRRGRTGWRARAERSRLRAHRPGAGRRRTRLPPLSASSLQTTRASSTARSWPPTADASPSEPRTTLHLDAAEGINMILITTAGKVGAEAADLFHAQASSNAGLDQRVARHLLVARRGSVRVLDRRVLGRDPAGRLALRRLQDPHPCLLAERSAAPCKRTYCRSPGEAATHVRAELAPVRTNLATLVTPISLCCLAWLRPSCRATTSDSTTVGRVVGVVEAEGADVSARSRSWRLPYRC